MAPEAMAAGGHAHRADARHEVDPEEAEPGNGGIEAEHDVAVDGADVQEDHGEDVAPHEVLLVRDTLRAARLVHRFLVVVQGGEHLVGECFGHDHDDDDDDDTKTERM